MSHDPKSGSSRDDHDVEPKWLSAFPTEDGYYWRRGPMGPPAIFEVQGGSGYWSADVFLCAEHEAAGVEWFGPLLVPGVFRNVKTYDEVKTDAD